MNAHLDFETRSVVDLPKAGGYVYAAHASTDVLCAAYAFGDGPVKLWVLGDPPPQDLFDHLAAGGLVVCHNAAFELLIWDLVCRRRYGWPPFPIKQARCTMAAAYAMSLPGSLERAAAAMGIREQKDMAGSRVMMQLAQPRVVVKGACPVCRGGERDCFECYGTGDAITWWEKKDFPEKFKTLYAYCVQDVAVERELDKRLMPLSPAEQEIWFLDQKINNRGVLVDLHTARNAIEVAALEKASLDAEMKAVTGDRVPSCRTVADLGRFVASFGIEVDGLAKADILKLLEIPDLPPVVRKVLTLRQLAAKTSVAKLQAMIPGAILDGRLRGMFQYHAAGTGRWGGRRVQLQNLPRQRMKQAEIDSIFSILKEADRA